MAIRQTKCSPMCVCCLIAKLNVRQMYHLYSSYILEVLYSCCMLAATYIGKQYKEIEQWKQCNIQ